MSQQPPNCPPVSSPNPEWDECVRAGSWTIGFGTILGAIATVFVGSEAPILIGTGLGMAWSIKRCRYLLRNKQAREASEQSVVCPDSTITQYKQLPAPEIKDNICICDEPVAKKAEKKSSGRSFFFRRKACEEDEVKKPILAKEETDSCFKPQCSPIVCDTPIEDTTCKPQQPLPFKESPPLPDDPCGKIVTPPEEKESKPPPPVEDKCKEVAPQKEEILDSASPREQEEKTKEKFVCCGRRTAPAAEPMPPPPIDQPPLPNKESNEQVSIPCIQEHDSCGARVYETPTVTECTCPPPVSYSCSCPPPQTEICTCNATPCRSEQLANHVKFTWPPLLTFAQVKKPLECTCPPTKQQAQPVCTCKDENCN